MNSASSKPLVIFLMGPTASGKTDLAMDLAQQLPIDLVSVDSALIYRGMDIGTAKPSPAELKQAPHALIDIRDPSESYSVADFCCDAMVEIEKSIKSQRIPLLVGGTMMYFNALLEGLAEMPATDQETRIQIEQEAREKGWPAMHRELMVVDPAYAQQVHPNHSQRIGRALAVYRISGKTMTAYRHEQAKQSQLVDRYHVVQLALYPKVRTWLHQRIQQRYTQMLDRGFVDEVRCLYERDDLHGGMPSIRAVGYRQVWQYLSGEINYAEMVEKGVVATRQLAKRQLTWLRAWKGLKLLEINTKTTTLGANREENLIKALNFLSIKSI